VNSPRCMPKRDEQRYGIPPGLEIGIPARTVTHINLIYVQF